MEIEKIRFELQSLLERSKNRVFQLPNLLREAEQHLHQAEKEFSEGAFAPFWDEIERATNKLVAYHWITQELGRDFDAYKTRSADPSVNASDFILPVQSIPDARFAIERLAVLTRKAQTDINFALIFQQMKTNRLLYHGFNSLGEAIHSIGREISDSLCSLSENVGQPLEQLVSRQALDDICLIRREILLDPPRINFDFRVLRRVLRDRPRYPRVPCPGSREKS